MEFVETNGIRMAYEVRGAGEPLICIMGITAPGAMWEPHVTAWEQHFQCIVADNRGVGTSDKPEGPYTSEQMADDYIGLIKALNVERVRIVGVSMGSTIAQQIALRCPERVASMILMSPWARCDRYTQAVFEHMKHSKAHLAPAAFMQYVQTLIFSKHYWDSEEGYQELLEGQAAAACDPFPQPLHGLEAQAAACISHNVRDKLGKIKCPCLVTGGKEDIFTPLWMNDGLHRGLSDSEQELFDEAGHAFHFEYVDHFNKLSTQWLKAHKL